ncbi:MAG: zinc ribbon domain-containing protein, partial [Deltaproteobacteria bacterium]
MTTETTRKDAARPRTRCPECQRPLAPEARFCAYCGEIFEESSDLSVQYRTTKTAGRPVRYKTGSKSCPSCFNRVSREATFCPRCSYRFEGKEGGAEESSIRRGDPMSRKAARPTIDPRQAAIEKRLDDLRREGKLSEEQLRRLRKRLLEGGDEDGGISASPTPSRRAATDPKGETERRSGKETTPSAVDIPTPGNRLPERGKGSPSAQESGNLLDTREQAILEKLRSMRSAGTITSGQYRKLKARLLSGKGVSLKSADLPATDRPEEGVPPLAPSDSEAPTAPAAAPETLDATGGEAPTAPAAGPE